MTATATLTVEQRDTLTEAALAARQLAYAPYSGYLVGSAVMAADGRVFTGCNVENASYPASICGERVAITKAVSEGARDFIAIAVATENGGAPCGICRQVMFEFAPGMAVYVLDEDGAMSEYLMADLLPDGFGPRDLPDTAKYHAHNENP